MNAKQEAERLMTQARHAGNDPEKLHQISVLLTNLGEWEKAQIVEWDAKQAERVLAERAAK